MLYDLIQYESDISFESAFIFSILQFWACISVLVCFKNRRLNLFYLLKMGIIHRLSIDCNLTKRWREEWKARKKFGKCIHWILTIKSENDSVPHRYSYIYCRMLNRHQFLQHHFYRKLTLNGRTIGKEMKLKAQWYSRFYLSHYLQIFFSFLFISHF